MTELHDVLRSKLLPWAYQEPTERFIVARPEMRAAHMPPGVKLVPHKITGQRVVVKNQRNNGNVRNIVAHWPEPGLHEVNKYALICVLDGYIDYQVGHYRLQCGPGHLIFVPPGTPHPRGAHSYVDLQRGTSCLLITFLLHPNAVECWMSHGTPRGRTISNNCLLIHEPVVALLKMLMQEVISHKEITPQVSSALLQAWLAMLQREIQANRFQRVPQDASLMAEAANPQESSFRLRLQNHINAHLQHKLTLDGTAREMYLSPTQFARVMRRETGMSFNEFLTPYRMEEARRLLRDSPWTAAMIGKYLGFKSPSYFRTFFKRHTGQTPMEFRGAAKR